MCARASRPARACVCIALCATQQRHAPWRVRLRVARHAKRRAAHGASRHGAWCVECACLRRGGGVCVDSSHCLSNDGRHGFRLTHDVCCKVRWGAVSPGTWELRNRGVHLDAYCSALQHRRRLNARSPAATAAAAATAVARLAQWRCGAHTCKQCLDVPNTTRQRTPHHTETPEIEQNNLLQTPPKPRTVPSNTQTHHPNIIKGPCCCKRHTHRQTANHTFNSVASKGESPKKPIMCIL